MRPLLSANISLPRKTKPGEALRAVHEGLCDAGLTPRLSFHIAHDQDRVLERLVDAAPILAPYRRPGLVADTVAEAPPLPDAADLLDQLALVADGISRRFQVRLFHVGFRDLDLGSPWSEGLPPDPRAAELTAAVPGAAFIGPAPSLDTHLAYRNAWWVSGRQQSLSALLVGESLPEDAAAPEVPAVLLEVLGRVKAVRASRFTRQALPDSPAELPPRAVEAPEDTAALARKLRIEALGRMADRARTGALPHALQASPGAVLPTGLDRKGALLAALRPHGWTHQGKHGGQGLLAFGKTTPASTRLLLQVDLGTWSRRFSPRLEAAGATWRQALPVQLAHGGAFVPTSADELQAAAENLAAAVADLEGTWVAGLEALLGASPAWTGQL